MAITDHRNEVMLVLENNIKEVWYRGIYSGYWSIVTTENAKWHSDFTYIANNKHSEIRKKLYDDKSLELEIYYNSMWCSYDKNEHNIDWCDDSICVRIKYNEWEVPEGEDPIKYHIKRLEGSLVIHDDNPMQEKWYIYKTRSEYKIGYHSGMIIFGTTYMKNKAAIEIAKALNDGDLVL